MEAAAAEEKRRKCKTDKEKNADKRIRVARQLVRKKITGVEVTEKRQANEDEEEEGGP